MHAKPLLSALKATQERSKVGPIQERLDSCRQLHRAKRVLRADEIIASTVEQKPIFEAEVDQAEQRLFLLQANAAATTPAVVVPEPAQVKELQTQIDLLVRERDTLKSTSARQVGGGEVSAMDGKRSPVHGEHSTDAHIRSVGCATAIAISGTPWSSEIHHWVSWS